MNMESSRNSPVVNKLASSGVAWAVKYKDRGWGALSTNQKRNARNVLNIPTLANVLTPNRPRVRNPIPRGQRNGPGTAGKTRTISHTEYICDIQKNTGTFPAFKSWVINPSNVRSFPEGSICTFGYNKYRITRFAIRVSPIGSFTVSGRNTIGFNSDASDPLPGNKTQLYGLKYHCEAGAMEARTLEIPTDNVTRYLRDNSTDDAKLVDFGRAVLATYGYEDSAPNVVGELFFEITMVLSEPTYVTSLTQTGTDSESKGPMYAKLVANPTSTVLTLEAPGKWLVTLTSPTAFTDSGTIGGEGAEGTINVLSDSNMIGIANINANGPGATLTFTNATTMSGLTWTVSRL